MARAHFSDVAIDSQGNFLAQAEITVFQRGSTDLATIYATETAGAAMTNPHLTTDGVVSLWAEAGAYDVQIRDTAVPPLVQTRTIGWGAVPGVNGGIPGALLETGSVGEIELANLAVASGKIKGLAVQTGHIADGNVTDAKLASGIDASKLTTGTLPIARISDGSVTNSKVASGLDAAKITTGAMAIAQLAIGVPNREIAFFTPMTNVGSADHSANFTLSWAANCLFVWGGSGYLGAGTMATSLACLVNGTHRSYVTHYFNQAAVHHWMGTNAFVLALGAGSHTVRIANNAGTSRDSNDFNNCAVIAVRSS